MNELLYASKDWLENDDQNPFFIVQNNPVPLSPAPARIVNGLARIAEDERKIRYNATDILCSENKCFSNMKLIYKKNQSDPGLNLNIFSVWLCVFLCKFF